MQTEVDQIKVNEYVRTYREIGVNSDELDRSVTKSINRFYEMLDREHPIYIFVDNPWEAKVVASALLGEESDIDPALKAEIEGGDTITRELIERLSKEVEVKSFNYITGNINAYWMSFLQFCRKELGVKYDYGSCDDDILDVWEDVINKTGYFFPFEKVCIMCNRPFTQWDENHELHCEDGPAIKFRRGTECDVYMIRGVKVPEHVVMRPETIDIDMINKEENAEVKRIMMEQMGIGNYLVASGAKLIDGDMIKVEKLNDENYTPRALMEDNEGRRFLVGSDGSTSRVYHMQVPKECNTCHEAGNALAGGRDERKIIAHS